MRLSPLFFAAALTLSGVGEAEAVDGQAKRGPASRLISRARSFLRPGHLEVVALPPTENRFLELQVRHVITSAKKTAWTALEAERDTWVTLGHVGGPLERVRVR